MTGNIPADLLIRGNSGFRFSHAEILLNQHSLFPFTSSDKSGFFKILLSFSLPTLFVISNTAFTFHSLSLQSFYPSFALIPHH